MPSVYAWTAGTWLTKGCLQWSELAEAECAPSASLAASQPASQLGAAAYEGRSEIDRPAGGTVWAQCCGAFDVPLLA